MTQPAAMTDRREPATTTRLRRAPADGPRLLSAQAAAKYLGVPYTSLRDWALRGHLPIVRVPDCRRLWFAREDLDRAIESWKETAERA
jgi:excisionase family DNA binding protein